MIALHVDNVRIVLAPSRHCIQFMLAETAKWLIIHLFLNSLQFWQYPVFVASGIYKIQGAAWIRSRCARPLSKKM